MLNATVPAALWLWLAWHLHFTWDLDEQYRFGWSVPLLAAFLFYVKWNNRPSPGTANRDRHAIGMWLVLFAFLPIRLIEEANPDWRLLSWIFAGCVIGYSLLEIFRTGGVVWVRYFAFPVCFMAVAVPWPVQFESFIVQSLTHAVAAAAVEIAGWVGVGAFQLGNIIQLRNGFVGVDEACSGVRTLQSAIMVSLFLGELLQLTARRRLSLFAIGCVWVFICNVARAALLVSIAATRGFDALHRAHDAVGTVLMVVGCAGLALAAWRLRPRSKVGQHADSSQTSSGAAVSPMRVLICFSWLALVFGTTAWWFGSHERTLAPRAQWDVRWPADAVSVPIADATRSILRFNQGASAAWIDENSDRWWGFFARWEPGRTAAQLIRSHSPEICLPALGRTFVRQLPDFTYTQRNLQLPFAASEFVQEGRPLFVFVSIQADKTADTDAGNLRREMTVASRLGAVLRGERNLGQRFLELAVNGSPDADSAQAEAFRTLDKIVSPTFKD